MIVKYCLKNLKNITVSRLITYIFICIMNIMVMLSVAEAINIPYNKYMFNLGVGSNYAHKTNASRYDMAFVNNISLGSGYSEEMTKPKSPLYCRRALETNVYLCEDFNCLQKSYFADNILSYDQTLLENNNDVIPIFISYDLMYELEVSEGDFLILYQYRTIYAKLQICGVLLSAGGSGCGAASGSSASISSVTLWPQWRMPFSQSGTPMRKAGVSISSSASRCV